MGLGIIDADLCMWAGTLTAADMEVATQTTGHPVLKAKPGPVGEAPLGWIDRFNCWVNDNPILAAVLVGGGYLMLSSRKARRKIA
jgi:hypothetical protein